MITAAAPSISAPRARSDLPIRILTPAKPSRNEAITASASAAEAKPSKADAPFTKT